MSAALEGSAGSLLGRLRRSAAQGQGRERYTLLGEIGHGGMGRVLRVWDEDLQRELALKEIALAPGDGSTPEERERLERSLERFVAEARITSQLDHPGIVPVHEIAVDRKGALYFTMPLVRGRDLQEVFHLARDGQEGWNLHRAVDVLQRAARAVAYAHSKGVVHRDLKPANVMVGRYGEVYVMDWGVALLVGSGERDVVVGTPAYMAPEQARGRTGEVDQRSDVYSLGAMLYELLAGKMPHETTLDQNPSAGVEGLSRVPPRPLGAFGHELPRELVSVCAKAMSVDPTERYASAMELADDLQAWLEGHVVSAHRTGRLERFRKWRERNHGLSLALEALLLVALASVGIVYSIQRSKLLAVARAHAESVRNSYAANLRAAKLALDGGGEGAKRSLEACAPEHRGWAWRHLALRSDTSTHRLAGHEGVVSALAFDRAGDVLVTASDDGTLRTWDVATGAALAVVRGHEGPVVAVAWSPRGDGFASGSHDRTVRLWSPSGEPLGTLAVHRRHVTALAFSPSGRRLASVDTGGGLTVLDLDGGPSVERSAVTDRIDPADASLAVAWLDEEHVVTAQSDGRLLVASAADGSVVLGRDLGSTVYALAPGPDGGVIAVGTLDALLLLDPATLEERGRLEDAGRVSALAWAGEGVLLTGGTDRTIQSWRPDGTPRAVFHGHEDAVLVVATHPDGGRFASGSADGTARIWDAAAAAVSEFAAVPDGGSPPPRLGLAAGAVAGGKQDGRPYLRALDGPGAARDLPVDVPCHGLAFAPDGSRLAIGSTAGPVLLLGTAGEDAIELRGAQGDVSRLVLDATGARLCTRGLDATLRMWDVPGRRIVWALPDAGNHASPLAFHPDGERVLVGEADGRVRVRAAADGTELATLETDHGPVSVVAFPFGDDTLVTAHGDGSILLWDLERGERVRGFRGSEAAVDALAGTPDGRRLFSASRDCRVRVWDRESSDPLLTLRCGVAQVQDIAYDPRTDRLVAVDADHRVWIWRTQPADG